MRRASLAGQFGTLVRRLRTKELWSQEEFAFRCGLHRTYIGAIERGEKTVTIDTAAKLSAALGLSMAQLFAELEEPELEEPELEEPELEEPELEEPELEEPAP